MRCLDMIPQKCVSYYQSVSILAHRENKKVIKEKYIKACLTSNADDWAAYHRLKKDMQRQCRTSCNNYVHMKPN